MSRIFVVHGWESTPGSNWFPWIKEELRGKGYEVEVPAMPNSSSPRMQDWVSKLVEVVGKPDQNTYFIGHSMGCSAITKYLETLPEGLKVGGAVFVAGFFLPLTPPSGAWKSIEKKEIADQWVKTPIDFEKIKPHLRSSVAIFSDNDPWVPLKNKDIFTDKLGSKVIVEHKAGHLNKKRGGFTELPQAVEAILALSR